MQGPRPRCDAVMMAGRSPDEDDVRQIEDAFIRLEPQFIELSENAVRLAPSARVHLLRCAAARAFGAPFDPTTELNAAMAFDATPANRSLARALELVVSGDPRDRRRGVGRALRGA